MPSQGSAARTTCMIDMPVIPEVTNSFRPTGGVIMPLNNAPQEAKLVRLDVGAAGRPLAKLR